MNHTDTDTGGAVFPVPMTMDGEGNFHHSAEHPDRIGGMTLREFAAIKLRVPNSGADWLDDMIRESLRDDFAGQALAGMMATTAHPGCPNEQDMARLCYSQADAMLKAREASDG